MFSTINYYLRGESVHADLLDRVSFTINGKSFTITASTCPIDTSLNTFIRDHALLRGTKFMCLEGGCGICSVYVERHDPLSGEKETIAVNSCLVLVFACHGLEITTIEGVGNRQEGFHPLQERLAHNNGSQCGMCSPGMVMTMYSLMKSKGGKVSVTDVENGLGGNLCRCTGYRPILDTFKSMATESAELCGDIEDFVKICPSSGSSCRGKCWSLEDKTPIKIAFEDGRVWHKVFVLQDVLKILAQIGDLPYILVCGDTAHGVYRRIGNLQVFIDCNSVEELHKVTISDSSISVGGNISLARFIDVLRDAASKNAWFGYCNDLADHVELVANPLVRNVGSIAGNLSLKKQYREFPSDVFLLLETVNAKLELVDPSNQSVTVRPEEFVMSVASKQVIKSVILPALDVNAYVFKSFKVMPRAQNAKAYVNAGFLVEFEYTKKSIRSARICIGNISPNFVHASQTESFLRGKNLFINDTLQGAIESLKGELEPDWVLPEPSAEYRKNLAIALFYKFVLNIAPPNLVKPQYQSGRNMLERPLSSGQHSFDTYNQYWPLTEEVPKLEGLAQCSGDAEYINDIPPFPGELFAAFVGATALNAKIAKIDASEALKVAGVVGFFTASDIPGSNNFTPQALGFPEVEEILCGGEVKFYDQPVGIIVAETFEIANKVVKIVEITYEKLVDREIVPTLNAACRNSLERQSCSETFEMVGEEYSSVEFGNDQSIRGRMNLGGQAHFPMETQSCVCIPKEDGMKVYPSTQWISVNQVAIAQMLKIRQNQVDIHVRRLGGSFGSKVSRSGLVACGAALAAHLTNRPVRFHLTMEANMNITGKRYGCISDYQVDVDANGRIVKLSNYFAHDFGLSFNEPIANTFILFFPNCYESKVWKIIGKMVKTDVPKNTWCRAPGTTESIATVETIIEHIAQTTGKDPLEIRYANMPKDSKMRSLIPEFLKSVDYETRKHSIDLFNANNRWKKRGIAWIPVKHLSTFHGIFNALVSIYSGDGTVIVTHGGIEMGQGINTKVAQVIASTLGISLDMVRVKPSTSWTSANNDPSGGSISSESVCYAACEACKTLLERIKPIREKYPQASWPQLIQLCYAESIDLSMNFMFRATDVKAYYIWSLCCTEVEIDILTGNILILRMDVQQDTGESMSPGVDLGQIEGAIVMGLGYYLAEELIYDDTDGRLLTNRTWNYKIFGVKDIPADFRVNFLKGSSNPCGVLRSKSTSEPPLTLSVVVLFALRNALRSARRDAGLPDDWIPLGSATTPEKIFLKAGNATEQFLLN